MLYTQSFHLQELERLMQTIPNFAPRGHGIIILREQCGRRVQTGTMTQKEILREALANIHSPPFLHRLDQYLQRKEEYTMNYRNERHKVTFAEIVGETNRQNYGLLAALYLLTADHKLWMTAKRKISYDDIYFEQMHLPAGTERAYILFSTAKDLYLGTKHLTVRDLADPKLISPELFALICNAMAIRRFGLGAVKFKNND